ncbi:peptidylprolyl isomerase [Hellea balneolensis]|uniref:peptidylprolyl isomerase n=1 Tax=Hellea balneolensis TaxID=287478 RepID=UPI0003F60B80|nr:peptidylprolyl isomerase [Hellea balneolensis]
MAESVGGKIRNFMVAILVGLLVVAFAVWGVNDVFTARAGNAVITVGDAEITSAEFEDAFSRELQTLNRDNGTSVTNQQAYAQGIHNRVLQNLLTDTVIGIDADELGVGVNRSVARDVVKDIPTFQNDLTGEFSEEKLNNILAQNRITRKQFEDDIFRTLRRQQTVPAIIGGLQAPAEYATQRYNFITEQRKAEVLTITAEAVPAPQEPSEEELKAYIDQNGAAYTAPEYRRVVMLRLEPFDLTPDMDATEDEVKAAFQYQIDLGEIGSPETRSVVQITATDEDTAIKAAEQLARGDDAVAVAAGLGLVDPEIYTDVLKDAILDPETAEAAYSLEQGKAKAVLGSLGNWYAVGVTAVTPAVIPDFDAQKDEIRETLLTEKAKEALYDITADIEDVMTDGLTLEEIGAKVGWPLSFYDYIDRSGTTRDGVRMRGFSAIPGIAADDILLREVFTSDLGFETDLFETGTEGYASIRVEDIIDSTMRPFEEIKDVATSAWKAEQTGEALDELAAELASKIQTGEDINTVAKTVQNGASVEDIVIVRAQPPRTLGNAVALGMLDGAVGAVSRGPGPDGTTRQVAKLTEIVPNQDGLAGQFLDVLQEQATQAISSDLQNAYQQAILRENELREYPDKVRTALGITDNQ